MEPPNNKPKTSSPALTIPNFVSQYYKTSTFHHLSTWKLQYQRLTTQLAQGAVFRNRPENEEASHTSSSSQSSSDELFFTPNENFSSLPPNKSHDRIIVHVDMVSTRYTILFRMFCDFFESSTKSFRGKYFLKI